MPIQRRKFIKGALLLPALSLNIPLMLAASSKTNKKRPVKIQRVRPGDPLWPSDDTWAQLKKDVNGNLIKIESPLAACSISVGSVACETVFKNLKNPYYIGDNPALTQSSGWLDAWSSKPSVYAVAATSTADVVAAVNFARVHNLRLVVKGGGHSYQGTSNSADSLLVWTRAMNRIAVHDSFVADGCSATQAAQPAVTIEAGAMWLQAYTEVTTKAGRYVQGGGCTTVGVAGLIQSGGFGSFSKHYGLAAAALLQAELVTADGSVKTVNECNDPDLFWALKGGGGGSFGVVTKLTLRTRELPPTFGVVFGAIKANGDEAYKKLIDRFIAFYKDTLFNPHWGEQVRFSRDNTMNFSMLFHGLSQQEAKGIWQPFIDWVSADKNYIFEMPLNVIAVPARQFWDTEFLKKYASSLILTDDRPNAPGENIYWMSNKDEAGQFLYEYHSAWLPATLLEKNNRNKLVDALFAASRYWGFALHFNKGLAGSPKEEIEAARNTAMNPAVLDAFALAIIASEGEAAFAGIKGHEPDVMEGRREAAQINKATNELLKIVPAAGSYVSESSFFEKQWQQSFWGSNYKKLAAVKKKYDPAGLFFVHHGAGSEEWNDDGFTRLG
jgi:FAD/FMN-containing dehydrogenase